MEIIGLISYFFAGICSGLLISVVFKKKSRFKIEEDEKGQIIMEEVATNKKDPVRFLGEANRGEIEEGLRPKSLTRFFSKFLKVEVEEENSDEES